ncbi:hypothetical protein LJC36_04660 [Desulfovibrio sp. OttesenSCG-928-C14]|nr:hypothetical protein [Desulfovibrio sp. OttesenSCG-928-C14]
MAETTVPKDLTKDNPLDKKALHDQIGDVWSSLVEIQSRLKFLLSFAWYDFQENADDLKMHSLAMLLEDVVAMLDSEIEHLDNLSLMTSEIAYAEAQDEISQLKSELVDVMLENSKLCRELSDYRESFEKLEVYQPWNSVLPKNALPNNDICTASSCIEQVISGPVSKKFADAVAEEGFHQIVSIFEAIIKVNPHVSSVTLVNTDGGSIAYTFPTNNS